MIFNEIIENIDSLGEVEKDAVKAKIDGSIKTIEFWKNIKISSYIDNKEDLLKKLSIYFKVLEDNFPDNWDLEWIQTSDGGLLPSLVIYFPEITVTESRTRAQHLIRGLGIRLKLINWENCGAETGPARFEHNLYGFRTHRTVEELYRNYVHSHLPSLTATGNLILNPEGKFCLGTSDIKDVFASLEECNPDNIDEYSTIFEMLCIMIVSHANTESYEGGPYISLLRLSPINVGEVWRRSVSTGYYDLESYLITEHPTLGFEFTFDGKKYIIRDNIHFEERIKELLSQYEEGNRMLVVLGADGREYDNEKTNQNAIKNLVEQVKETYINGEVPFTYISGRKIELTTILSEDIEEEKVPNLRVAKSFLNYAKQQIEDRINRNFIRNTAIRAYNKAVLEGVHNGENSLPM